MRNVFMTRIKDDFDKALAGLFLENGYKIYFQSGSFADKNTVLVDCAAKVGTALDVFIDTTDVYMEGDKKTIRDGLNLGVLEKSFDENVNVPLAALEQALPLMEKGEMKRIFFITSSDASVNSSEAVSGYGYNMSKAAYNNIMAVNKNRLYPMGYTFRAFDPMKGQITADKAAASAFIYIIRDRYTDSQNEKRTDEARYVMRDALGRECPW